MSIGKTPYLTPGNTAALIFVSAAEASAAMVCGEKTALATTSKNDEVHEMRMMIPPLIIWTLCLHGTPVGAPPWKFPFPIRL